MLATYAPSPRFPLSRARPTPPTIRRREFVEQASPLEHRDWDESLSAHENVSFFHTAAWSRVLNDTYGHAPTWFLHRGNLLPMMEINSWLTGRRGVALPFTDDCEPLCHNESSFQKLFEAAADFGVQHGWKHLELRGGRQFLAGATPSLSFFGHRLDLTAGESELFSRFDSATRRAIRKAEKEGVTVEITHRFDSLLSFYELQCLTRRRHGLPPQPFAFFRNLHQHVLSRNAGFIALAHYQKKPVAGAVFFFHGPRAVFKFGASDESFQHLRGNNLAMWEAIKTLARHGLRQLDFGKTAEAHDGLRRFKLGWGATEHRIEYFKFNLNRRAFVPDRDQAFGWHNRIFQSLPLPASRLIGSVLYRHWA